MMFKNTFFSFLLFNFSMIPFLAKSSALRENFILNNFNEASNLAKSEKKLILINFSAGWCPPCNTLEEIYFTDPKFKNLSKELILLKIDSDLSSSWTLKSKYKIKEYPTVVFTDSLGNEISRVVGLIKKEEFFERTKYSISNNDTPLIKLLIEFEKNKNIDIVWKILDHYISIHDYKNAMVYIPYAIKHPKLTLAQLDIITMVPLMVQFEKNLIDDYLISTIKNSITEFPNENTSFKKFDILENISESVNDQSLKKWLLEQKIKTCDSLLLKNKKSTSLLEAKAYTLEQLNQPSEARKIYSKIVSLLEAKMIDEKINPETNRGFNMEKAYSLYKSGNYSAAAKLFGVLMAKYPNDFTFYYNYSKLLTDSGKFNEAQPLAEKALKLAYGDNKLKVALLLSEILVQLDKTKEALKLIETYSENTELPDDKTLRTRKYYKKLIDLQRSLKK